MAHDLLVGHRRRLGVEVALAIVAQAKPRGLDGGGFDHGCGLEGGGRALCPRDPGLRRDDEQGHFLPSVSPPKRLLKRATWPPESTSLPWPPVQAGWTLGSMSSCSVSPSLPQVERVSKVVPSVICTLIV